MTVSKKVSKLHIPSEQWTLLELNVRGVDLFGTLSITDTVRELSDCCFTQCKSLCCVTFGYSLPERMGTQFLAGSGLKR